MAGGVTAEAEALVAGEAAEVFEAVVGVDPARWYPRYGPLPAVTAVTDQSAPFTELGARRTLHLSDGGTVTEQVADIAAPRFHAYELTGFQKLFGRLVDHARAEWTFTAEPGGVRIRWTYTFFALPGRGPVVSAIVALFWARYMRRVLPPIAREAGPLLG